MWLRAFFIWSIMVLPVLAEPVRVAMYNVELDRDGPGLLLRDILKGEKDIEATVAITAQLDADILLLTRFDYDLGLVALKAFNDKLGDARYPYLFARRPNIGRPSGLDLNKNGRLGEPEDAISYGRYAGHNGMAILSRFPIAFDEVRDFSEFLWRKIPDARLPVEKGAPFWSAEITDRLRLSTVAHWDVPIQVGRNRLHLLAFHASPPIFDGPEDRNGLRAADEVRFWQLYLDGAFGPAPTDPFVILGTTNIDPEKGDGRHDAMIGLLHDPRLNDPRPSSAGGQSMDAPLDTADFSELAGLSTLRVDYVLPAKELVIESSGVMWPEPGAADAQTVELNWADGSRHRPVWVDLYFPEEITQR